MIPSIRTTNNDTSIVRLKSIQISNFGNVELGYLKLDTARHDGNTGSVLGIYGPNGSGKSTLIQAMNLIRRSFAGEAIVAKDTVATSYLNHKDAVPTIECKIQITDSESDKVLDVVYILTLSSVGEPVSEILKYSRESKASNVNDRMSAAFNTGNTRKAFSPDVRHDALVTKYSESIKKWWNNLSENQKLAWTQTIVLDLWKNDDSVLTNLARDIAEDMPTPQLAKKYKDAIVDSFLFFLSAPPSHTTIDSVDQRYADLVGEENASNIVSIDSNVSIDTNYGGVFHPGKKATEMYTRTRLDRADFVNSELPQNFNKPARFDLKIALLQTIAKFEIENSEVNNSLQALVEWAKGTYPDTWADMSTADSVHEIYTYLMVDIPVALAKSVSHILDNDDIEKLVAELLKKLQYHQYCEGQSFIFSVAIRDLYREFNFDDTGHVLNCLHDFALKHWFIVESLLLADSMNDRFTVLHFPQPLVHPNQTKVIEFDLRHGTELDYFQEHTARKALESVQEALSLLLPDVKIELKEISPQKRKFVVESILPDSSAISLADESAGIRRLVNILLLLRAMYNDPSTTVVIDELDAFLFEYLLGQMVAELSAAGKGQLIFTSHNLHLLEVLGPRCIAFTTRFKNNRYVTLKNIKKTNNLRDVYHRIMKTATDDQPLYKPISQSDMRKVFRIPSNEE